MRTFLLTRTDGGTSVMRIYADSTIEKELAKWPETERAKIVSSKEIDETTIPIDRTFREAWSSDPVGSLIVDIEKAKEVWRNKIREARAPVFLILDAEYAKAVESGDEARRIQIVERKQYLRDMPQDSRIEKAATLEELKAVWPEKLGTWVEDTMRLQKVPPKVEPPVEEEPKKEDKL